MSKNRKLGRGLQQMFNQNRTNTNLTNNSENEPQVSRETNENEEVTQESLEETDINPTKKEIASDSSQESETVESTGTGSSFHFDLMREDLEQAAVQVSSLQQEVGEIASGKKISEESQKTLLDYMKSSNLGDTPVDSSAESLGGKTLELQSSAGKTIAGSRVPSVEKEVERIYNISVSLVDSNPWQPREIFQPKEIEELAKSIQQHGLLQPIVVRKFRSRYQLVAGERRFRAAIKLNWTEVPATIIDATDREMAELALIENLQRKDLNPIEKATSFNKYLSENHSTQDELAKRLNLDRSTVANLIRLLSLPTEIQKLVAEEKLTQGHARALLALNTSSDQISLAKRAEEERLTVRQVEQIVSDWNATPLEERRAGNISDVSAQTPNPRRKEKDPNIQDLERQLRDALDLKVKISSNPEGKGKLEIFFRNNDEFQDLIGYFRN